MPICSDFPYNTPFYIKPISLYGLFIEHQSIQPRKDRISQFFPGITDQVEIEYRWRLKIIQLAIQYNLVFIEQLNSLDFYLGIAPLYPWEPKTYTSQESAKEQICQFLSEYYLVDTDNIKKKINYINTALIEKGDDPCEIHVND